MEPSLSSAKSLIEEKKYSEANEILAELTYRGNTEAAKLLAENHFYGRGVDKDRDLAYTMINNVIERTQNIKLIEFLGDLRIKDFERVRSELNEKERTEFYEETFNLFLGASYNNSGNPSVYLNLGIFYESGTGTEIDLESAQTNYSTCMQLSYKNLNEYSMYYLYSTFLLGRLQLNIETKKQEGANLILGIAQNLNIAQIFAGRLYYEGKLVEKDDSKAFTYFKQAAAIGIYEAQFYLAEMYENGVPNVCEKNINKAIELYFSVSAALVNRGKCVIESLPLIATSPENCYPINQRSIEKLRILRPQLLDVLNKYEKIDKNSECTRSFTKNDFYLQANFTVINCPGFPLLSNVVCDHCMKKCYDGYPILCEGISQVYCDCKCSHIK